MATYNITVQVHTQDEVDLDTAKALLEKSLRLTQPRYTIPTERFYREAFITIGDVEQAGKPTKGEVEESDPVQLFTSFIDSIFANK